MLLEQCHKKVNNEERRKTKTTHIIDQISDQDYTRRLREEFATCNRQETKTIMIARFRMLKYGVNFKGSLKEICNHCKIVDDENHRLNYCKNY